MSKDLETRINQNEKDVKKLKEGGDRLRQELKDSEVTYSIGDRFKGQCRKYILCWSGQGRPNEAMLVDLTDGGVWSSGNRILDKSRITEAELVGILGRGKFTRYWDNQKGARV